MPYTAPHSSAGRFQPQPIEESVKKVRRFAPELVETTTRNNGKENDVSINTKDGTERQAPRKRVLPSPLETTFKSTKHPVNAALPTPDHTPVATLIPRTPSPKEPPKPSRPRFAPQLIETTKRSKKASDSTPALLPTDKTDPLPKIYTRRKIIAPANTPKGITIISHILPHAPRRQGSMRPHPNTRRSTRQISFHPELDAIPSDENSNDSDEGVPSLTGSFTSSDDSLMRLQLSRTRESCDDRFSGYLLELAAKAAEKQLREQALAAFPNESLHEVVEHFYDREIDFNSDDEFTDLPLGFRRPYNTSDRRPSAIRRKSTEIGWMAKEIRAHQEMLNRKREEETNAKIAAEATKPTFKDPFWTNGMTYRPNVEKSNELRCMRSAASPPMLGGDLVFRLCPSPKTTKFETDQKIDVQLNRCQNGGGLWGGYCVAEEIGEYISPSMKGPSLIHTPHSEREDPFSGPLASELAGGGSRTPKSKESGLRMLAGIDERLQAEIAKAKAEEELFEEFDETFVTQVYNYLSLGYPSLARPFDEELARISGTAVSELRIDDDKQDAKGYIGIVGGFSCQDTPPEKRKRTNGKPAKERYCARWKALRIYILEWARQHPNLANGAMGPSAWGVRARRGSWAI